jgi:hypothetical protein
MITNLLLAPEALAVEVTSGVKDQTCGLRLRQLLFLRAQAISALVHSFFTEQEVQITALFPGFDVNGSSTVLCLDSIFTSFTSNGAARDEAADQDWAFYESFENLGYYGSNEKLLFA